MTTTACPVRSATPAPTETVQHHPTETPPASGSLRREPGRGIANAGSADPAADCRPLSDCGSLRAWCTGTERAQAFARRLHRDLQVVDVQGWDAQVGRSLIGFISRELIDSVLAGVPLYGAARVQAHASALQNVWEALGTDTVRTAANPWSALWTVARRAASTEALTAALATSRHKAWRVLAETRDPNTPTEPDADAVTPPVRAYCLVSLEALVDDADFDLPAAPEATGYLGPLLTRIAWALIQTGWPGTLVDAVLGYIADGTDPAEVRAGVPRSWRALAMHFGLPGWQARRLQALICGTGTWTGLLERLAQTDHHGDHAADDLLNSRAVRQQLASTRDHTLPPPERIAHDLTRQAS